MLLEIQKNIPSVFRFCLWILLVFCTFISVTSFFIFYMPGNVQYTRLPSLSEDELRTSNRLREHVIHLSDTIGERHFLETNSLNRAADYIVEQFQNLNYKVDIQRFGSTLESDKGEFKNIIVELTGKQEPDKVIVVGAHYDTVWVSPGADDNASGIAVLLEIARRLQGHELDKSIRFVAFSNEENPFYGSEHMGSVVYSRSLNLDKENIQGMISLEMLGYFSDDKNSQNYPWPINWFYPDKGNFIAFVGNLQSRDWLHSAIVAFRQVTEFPSEGLSAPMSLVPDIKRSDQISFWKRDIPGFMLTDTANFRNPHYHLTGDDYDTLDYEKMSHLVIGLSKMLLQLASVDNG